MAGNQNLTPVEGQLKETLELLADRHGLPPPPPEAAAPPWLPHGHALSHIEVGARSYSRPLLEGRCSSAPCVFLSQMHANQLLLKLLLTPFGRPG